MLLVAILTIAAVSSTLIRHYAGFSWLLAWMTSINSCALLVYGWDKWKARNRGWRVSEATLLSVALLGGSVGALGGMHLFRHKTAKPSFQVWFWLLVLLQIAAAFAYLRWGNAYS